MILVITIGLDHHYPHYHHNVIVYWSVVVLHSPTTISLISVSIELVAIQVAFGVTRARYSSFKWLPMVSRGRGSYLE